MSRKGYVTSGFSKRGNWIQHLEQKHGFKCVFENIFTSLKHLDTTHVSFFTTCFFQICVSTPSHRTLVDSKSMETGRWGPVWGDFETDFGHRISDDMDFIETMVTQKSIQKSIQSQLADLCFPLKWPFADSIFRQTHMSIDFLNLKQGHARNLIQSFDMIRSWTKNCQ